MTEKNEPKNYEGQKMLNDLQWVLLSDSIAVWSYDPLSHYGSNPDCDVEAWFREKSTCVKNKKWLYSEDFDKHHLQQWLGKRKSRRRMVLGYYFGYLIEYFLRFSPATRLESLSTGLLILDKKSGRTVGSLKFLFSLPEKPETVYHLECSIKFFCLVSNTSPISLNDYVGPNLAEVSFLGTYHI